MDKQDQVAEVTKVLEKIGLKFAHSVAVQLVDADVGTKDRFEVYSEYENSEDNSHLAGYMYDYKPCIKSIDYEEE